MTTPDFKAPGKPKMSGKKKLWLYGGGAALGGIGIILYRRHSASTASSSTGTSSTDSGIDPATGIPYADEYGAAGTPGLLGTYDPSTGSYYSAYGGGIAGTSLANNAEWAQAAVAQLSSEGYNPATVSTAIGLYLAGQALTQNQYDIVQAAIALEGQPPSGAPPAHLTNGGGTGQGNPPVTTGPGSKPVGGKVTVPNVIGSSGLTARLALAARGLNAKQDPAKTPIGKRTTVNSQTPNAGTKVKLGSSVTTHVTVQGPTVAKNVRNP